MKNEENSKKGKRILKRGFILLSYCLLTGWALKERSRADKLAGENENLKQQVRGAQRTINILNYNLGKEKRD